MRLLISCIHLSLTRGHILPLKADFINCAKTRKECRNLGNLFKETFLYAVVEALVISYPKYQEREVAQKTSHPHERSQILIDEL